MNQPTHSDLSRDFGRMEGRMDAIKEQVESLTKNTTEGFTKIEVGIERMESRLDSIDKVNAERRGAWKVIVAVASAAGALAGMIFPLIIGWFTKG